MAAPHILVVDDQPINVQLLKRKLEREGIRVTAANEEILRNDILMNVLGLATIYLILLFTYRSFAAGIYMLLPLFVSNGFVNAYMSLRNIGVNLHTLPVVTVGIGFGIDYGLYIVSRIIEEIRVSGDLYEATKTALCTTGKGVA